MPRIDHRVVDSSSMPEGVRVSRRLANKVTSALILVGLGLVIALSARTLPGQEGEEEIADLSLAMPDWFWPLIEWTALGFAGLMAIFLILSIRRGAKWDWSDLKRVVSRLFLIPLWAGAFYFIYAITRPPEDGGSPPAAAPDGGLDGGVSLDVGPVFSSALVAAMLTVLVVLAFIARAVMTRETGGLLQEAGTADSDPSPAGSRREPGWRPSDGDPRDRVISAYVEFESGSDDVGVGRGASETPRRHALRVSHQIEDDREDLDLLGSRYEMARFGDAELGEDDASAAEAALDRILNRLGL